MFALVTGSFLFQKASAQIHGDIQVNIGAQPVWGPVGYDRVDYYYLPDIDAYYNVPRHQYVYQHRGQWRYSSTLPHQYRNYNLDRGYKVVVNDPEPYLHNDQDRENYAKYKGNHDQEIIRNSHDSKYYQIKEHPEHDNWEKQQRDHH